MQCIEVLVLFLALSDDESFCNLLILSLNFLFCEIKVVKLTLRVS